MIIHTQKRKKMYTRLLIVIIIALLAWKFLAIRTVNENNTITLHKAVIMDASHEKYTAQTHLNEIREAMGMNALLENTLLNTAAQAHADYLVHNNEHSHDEIEGNPLFTGKRPIARALYANYPSRVVSENLSTQNLDGLDSIDSLFAAIYHRFAFLNPKIDEFGLGVSQDATKEEANAFVYLMANSNIRELCQNASYVRSGKYYDRLCKKEGHHIGEKAFQEAKNLNTANNPEIIIYPYDGQKEVPPAFYAEIPDPLPDYDVSGFPVSISFNPYFFKKVQLKSFRLYDDKDILIEGVRLMDSHNDPHSYFRKHQYALFPLKRLNYNSKYRAEVSYRVGEEETSLSWSFTTKHFKSPLHVISKDEESLTLAMKQEHILYFKPNGPHDILKNIQFPEDISLEFLDSNTLRLNFNNENSASFDIKSEHKVLHIDLD